MIHQKFTKCYESNIEYTIPKLNFQVDFQDESPKKSLRPLDFSQIPESASREDFLGETLIRVLPNAP